MTYCKTTYGITTWCDAPKSIIALFYLYYLRSQRKNIIHMPLPRTYSLSKTRYECSTVRNYGLLLSDHVNIQQ